MTGIGRAWSQERTRLPLIGVLSPGPATGACGLEHAGRTVCNFVEGLHALGYVENGNVAIAYRFADGNAKLLPGLARDLVALRPDVIYTHTGLSADAAATATNSIPIVVGPAGEITLTRLAKNLARPATNVTGTTLNAPGQDEKCIQLLKELAPRTARLAVVFNPDNTDFRDYPGVLSTVAARANVSLIGVPVRSVADLRSAFHTIAKGNADAILLTADNVLTASEDIRPPILDWASKHRLPVASPSARVAVGGGLVSLSTDLQAPARRAAFYVHRILNGAKPADLPVELPTTFRLSVNRKSATALGLSIPQSVLIRVDELIE